MSVWLLVVKLHQKWWTVITNYFTSPDANDRVILFLFCLFVFLSVCLSVVNFKICYIYNVWTGRHMHFIFGIYTPLVMPFQMSSRWPRLWPLCLNKCLDFATVGGIVFYIYIMLNWYSTNQIVHYEIKNRDTFGPWKISKTKFQSLL